MSYTKVQGNLRPLHKDILVSNMYFGERKTSTGIILNNDDGKSHGVRPRWAKIYAVGPEQTELSVGQWILVEHGRWSRKVQLDNGAEELEIQKIDADCILLVSDEDPSTHDEYISDSY